MINFEAGRSILEGLAANNKSAIDQIYRENYAMIQAMVVNNSGSGDDAADVFQETMMVLYEKATSENFELNCQLKTFIYSIARRIWLKKLNSNQIFTPASEENSELVAVEEDLEYHEKRQQEFSIMENALSKMGEPCKSLLEAYYLQKKQMQQIAQEFGYTNADNAKTQKYKCLVRLKKLFFQQYKNL